MRKTLLIIFALGAIFLAYKYWKIPMSPYPLPYKFKSSIKKNINIDKKNNVLLIGDEGIKIFSPYLKIIESKKISENSSIELEFAPLKNFSIIRINNFLSQLKTYPKNIVVMLSSSFHSEKLYKDQDTKNILKNLDLYQNEKISTLLHILPQLSPLIYNLFSPQILEDKIAIHKKRYTNEKQLQIKELNYKLFEIELKKLIQLSKSKEFNLIFITPPINYFREIGRNCSAKSNKLNMLLEAAKENIEKGYSKAAYSSLSSLESVIQGNPLAYRLLAQVNLKFGKNIESLKNAKLSRSLDCSFTGADPILNSIAISMAKKNEIQYIDFEKILYQKYGFNDPFKKNDQPKDEYIEIAVLSLLKILAYFFQF